MSVASLVLLTLSCFLTLLGLLPCLGWLNWIGSPLGAVTAIVGLAGLAFDRDARTGRAEGVPAHLAAVVGGTVLCVIAALRCMIGGGVA